MVIVRPPVRFAILETRALAALTALAPEISTWRVGGHSLGGVRACAYAAETPERIAGLVLLGSYCDDDISGTALPVLSVGGSADALSTPRDIGEKAHLLPPDATFVQIDGMSHAQFGAYGEQGGDGTATIDDEAARNALAKALIDA